MIVLPPLRVLPHPHRITIVRNRPVDLGWTGQRRRQNPAGKDAGKLLDRRLIIGGDRIAAPIQLPGAVPIQEEGPDGEQLQDLARVIFIRLRPDAVPADGRRGGRASLTTVVQHVEETTHRRMQGHVREQLAIVAKRSPIEQLLIASHPARERHVHPGDHQDLAQGERDPLAQLVLAIQGIEEEMALEQIIRVVVPLAISGALQRRTRLRPEREIRIVRQRGPELLVQERLEPDALHVGDQGNRRAKCRLLEKAHGVRPRRLPCHRLYALYAGDQDHEAQVDPQRPTDAGNGNLHRGASLGIDPPPTGVKRHAPTPPSASLSGAKRNTAAAKGDTYRRSSGRPASGASTVSQPRPAVN